MKYIVEKYERTCIACPSQWDIWTVDGKYIYGRYRWGHFTLTLNAFNPEKEEKELMSWYGENSLDGTMDNEEMIELTKQVLDWSKVLPLEENTPKTGKMINLSVLMRTFPGFIWWDNVAELCGINFETKQFIVIEDGMCVSYPDIDHFYSWCCHGYNLPEIPEDWKKLKYCASDDKYMEEWKQLTF